LSTQEYLAGRQAQRSYIPLDSFISYAFQTKLWQESEMHRSVGLHFEKVVEHLPWDKQLQWAEFLQTRGQEILAAVAEKSELPADFSMKTTPKKTMPRPRPIHKKLQQTAENKMSQGMAELHSAYQNIQHLVPDEALGLFGQVSRTLKKGGPEAQVVASVLESWSVPVASLN
jgi:hypothetical protein